MPFFDQGSYGSRFEWGPEAARALAPNASAVVVVDVLSFSTAIDIACSRGAVVFPGRRDDDARARAEALGATLAVPRLDVTTERPYSLSPATMLQAGPESRILLPSPNGSAISTAAAESSATVIAGCLRNARVVAEALCHSAGTVLVVACGERWTGGEECLRPCLEDLIGAGAILRHLDDRSPEADAAVAVFDALRPRLGEAIERSSSGRELIEAGFGEDVRLAAELDVSECVPVLDDGAYRWRNGREG